jgi:hypothetical protein
LDPPYRFLVAADLGSHGFERMTELVDLHGQARQGCGSRPPGAVVLDQRAQVALR